LIRRGFEVYGRDENGAKLGSGVNPFKYDNHISGSIKNRQYPISLKDYCRSKRFL